MAFLLVSQVPIRFCQWGLQMTLDDRRGEKELPSLCGTSSRWQHLILSSSTFNSQKQPHVAQWQMLRLEPLMRQKQFLSSKCLKFSKGEDTKQIRNCDQCCEDVQVPLRAYHRRMMSMGWLHLGTSGFWHKYIRIMTSNHIQRINSDCVHLKSIYL